MNGNPYSSHWIGATGEYPIYDYVNVVSLNSSNFTIFSSNTLETISSNYTTSTSNILQTQITATSDIIHTDNDSNVIIKLVAQNNYYPLYPLTEKPIEMLFETTDGDVKTKINQDGELMVYHPAAPLPAGFGPGWWGVENKFANIITDTEGLRFDVTNLQVATGATAITETSTATAAAAGAAAGAAAAAGTTAAAGATIAQGDYGAVALGVAGGALFSVLGYLSYQAQVESNLTSNGFTTEAAIVHSNINLANVLLTENISNIAIAKGFITSNSLYAHNYVSSNVLSNLNTNYGFITSNSLYAHNYVSSNVLSNLNINYGFINSNIKTQQYIPTLKCDTLNLNTGNINNINGITANEIIANGKIKQNNILLDNTYLTSNHIYNLSNNYSPERQYPSKLYTTTSTEDTATLLGKLVYHQILYLDSSSISHGSGFYEIYSSSTYDTSTTKDRLFNYNTTDTTLAPRWGFSLYNSGTGNYSGDNSIDNSYYGDWVIIKLPQPIMLTRYRIYQRTDFPLRAPSEWKVYGSNDGITFTQITEAHQLTRLSSYTSGYYEKTLATAFTTQYQYLGFVFGKLLSTSGETTLNFTEIQIFGKEIISNTIVSNIYTTSNAVKDIVEFEMPRVCKHYGIYCSIETPIVINSITYYKYDLNISQYLKKGVIQIGNQSGDTYYTYKLSMFYASNFFDIITAGQPNVCSYDIYQSYKQNGIGLGGGGGYQGINICAVGIPPNPLLKNILDIDFWVMRNGANSLDYITLVARQVSLVRVVLEDRIG